MAHYAHSVAAKSEDHWQPLADHLKAVAALAESRGGKFGASRAAFVAGLLHDLGKYTKQFQRRLDGGERVDHATAGARTIMERAAKPDRLCAELIAYAIAGHHGGLAVPFDAALRKLTEETTALVHRLLTGSRLPPAVYEARKCRACSLVEACRPRLSGRSARTWRALAIAAAAEATADSARGAGDEVPT